jgi:AAA15 family ATPase/GTPase
MRIKKLHIRNFKSLVDFQLENLPAFAAIVGPNASGKSNIFEALEFTNYVCRFSFEATSFFGGKQSIYSYNARPIKELDEHIPLTDKQSFYYEFEDDIFIDLFLSYLKSGNNIEPSYGIGSNKEKTLQGIDNLPPLKIRDASERKRFLTELKNNKLSYNNDYEIFIDNFSRIFIGKNFLNRSSQSQSKLHPDASNLSQVLGHIFDDANKKDEFIEWLRILIPEFKNIEVKKSNIDGSFEFFLYEKTSDKPFPKYLLSDGTYNILALMAAVYQSDSPQFLCIEEPENGLHPQAIQLLVDFLREKSEEKKHHILLNTHSQTLVRCLEAHEIILVNKVNGETIAKQLTKEDDVNIKTDEAWLSNAFGGGILWSK